MMVGVAHSGSGGAADSLTFSTLNSGHRRTIASFGPEDVVSYDLVRNPEQSGWYMLERSQWSGLTTSQTAPTPPVILADNVISLHMRYFDGQTWLENWDSASLPRARQLPIAVIIELAMAAPYGHTMHFSTQITLPMAVMETATPKW